MTPAHRLIGTLVNRDGWSILAQRMVEKLLDSRRTVLKVRLKHASKALYVRDGVVEVSVAKNKRECFKLHFLGGKSKDNREDIVHAWICAATADKF
jgi:uncharacterized protein (DUF2132 family)